MRLAVYMKPKIGPNTLNSKKQPQVASFTLGVRAPAHCVVCVGGDEPSRKGTRTKVPELKA